MIQVANQVLEKETPEQRYWREREEYINKVNLSNNTFKFNDCGVCTNPEQIYYFQPEGELTWRDIKLIVCFDGNSWDTGVSHFSGGCPCGILGKSKSREEAINKGIEKLKKFFRECDKNDKVFGNCSMHEKHFFNWLASRKQLSLF